jgi:hypothetical protein
MKAILEGFVLSGIFGLIIIAIHGGYIYVGSSPENIANTVLRILSFGLAVIAAAIYLNQYGRNSA